MHLQFYGAAGGVTGSLHRLQANGKEILLDCGLFQGRREETFHRNRELPKWATSAEAVVLSHAHIDHSGNLPSLVRRGFSGNIYCTPATRDLCSVMLRDAAMIQEQDAAYLNRRLQRDGSERKVEPLYTAMDAQKAVGQMISVPLHRPLEVSPGVKLTFHNSGHVLGSALVQIDLHENGRRTRLVFTGDLGREELPLLQSPEHIEDVQVLLMESTYGDRLHPNIEGMDQQLGAIVRKTIERKGRVYIPSFALERAQEILFSLERLHDKQAIPRVPIYIDSPLAIAITEIYKLHPEGLAEEVQARILSRNDPFSPPGLHYVSDVSASKALQASGEPCIIIAGSGMCEGGRILHHFRQGLGDSKNSVIIVGFMAQHTLGRRLLEGRRKAKVFGVERDVWAEIHAIDGLSAHADQSDLLDFAKKIRERGHLKRIALVHGEEGPQATLTEKLKEIGITKVISARAGERLNLG